MKGQPHHYFAPGTLERAAWRRRPRRMVHALAAAALVAVAALAWSVLP